MPVKKASMQSAATMSNPVTRSAAEKAGLNVGGLTPLTAIDFPGRLAAVVYCQGCPWRCSYCHNPELQDASASTDLSWDDVMAFLGGRRGLLDGVVFSGGEPTLQSGLGKAMEEVRELGFQVALHTAGMYPERLARVLPLVDWVGFDIKAPLHHYDEITGVPGSSRNVGHSLELIKASGVDYECRTTWHPSLFAEYELKKLADTLAKSRVRHWALQSCRLPGLSPPRPDVQLLAAQFESFTLRGV